MIHLAVASDARYLTRAIGTLASIRLAAPLETEIRMIFLHDRLSRREQRRVHDAMGKLQRGPEVEFMRVDDDFSSFPAFSFGSSMAYARLVMPALFRGRAIWRKLTGRDGFWDLREAEIWARHNRNLKRMGCP